MKNFAYDYRLKETAQIENKENSFKKKITLNLRKSN